jgi:hypothetical protein
MDHRLPLAVLLDLDDTILDDSGNVEECWMEACGAHRLELGHPDPAVLCEAIGRVREWYWADPDRCGVRPDRIVRRLSDLRGAGPPATD